MVLESVFELSALDVVFFVLLIVVVYKLFFKKGEIEPPPPKFPTPLPKQDLTVQQLLRYNGKDDEHICLAILGNIYEVSKGRDFYGPDGPYGNLAGHDATRALGTLNIKDVKDEYDDISDLKQDDLDDAKEWEDRLSAKYPLVGRLLKPGEEPTVYENTQPSNASDSLDGKKDN